MTSRATPVSGRLALLALEEKRDEDGRTPCQAMPFLWDDNPQLSPKQRRQNAALAQDGCLECHALWQCQTYAATQPNMTGVIAGQSRLVFRGARPKNSAAGNGDGNSAATRRTTKESK
jgi:hypothetical protein